MTQPTNAPSRRSAPDPLIDQFGRPLQDLRISITDRCNFRCSYCMPRETFGPDFAFLPRSAILTFEEISRLARIFASFGVRKIRLTGGEPLLRSDLPVLITELRTIPDLEIAMTTNGALLATHAEALAAAGLDRITVSLDSLDDATFRAMNDANFPVAKVLHGIEAALAAGLGPIKINAVVRTGINDDGILALARKFRDTPHTMRFIEYMDVGTSNGWKLDEVASGQTILDQLMSALPLEPVEPAYRGEVAKRWRYASSNGKRPSGEIGIITSVTQPFCDDCTRARLSAEGKLYTCLFANTGIDLRAPLRDGASDEAIAALIRSAWQARDDRYSQLRSDATVALPKIEMSYIGG
jgi:cyclic pyranopterin phosphate synthase